MAGRRTCKRDKYLGFYHRRPWGSSPVKDIDRPDELVRILLAQLDRAVDFFLGVEWRCRVLMDSTYMVFIRSTYLLKQKLHESINNHNPIIIQMNTLIPCYTCEDNQLEMIACREHWPLQDFHHIVLGVPSISDDVRVRLALGHGLGLVLNEPILGEAMIWSRTTASTRGWKLEMC